MDTKFKEKRKFPRIRFLNPVRYQIRGIPEFNNVISDNLGLGGVSFINDRFIAPQTLLMLEINVLARVLNPVGSVAWSANVAHSDKYNLGIEFLEMDAQKKAYLKDYINLQRGMF